jgi:hypothetical protein
VWNEFFGLVEAGMAEVIRAVSVFCGRMYCSALDSEGEEGFLSNGAGEGDAVYGT